MLPNLSRRIKVFVDTSVLIAGTASVTGASAVVLDLCESGIIQMVISRQVLVEADRNFSSKLPRLLGRFRLFLRNLSPILVDDPSPSEIKKWASFIVSKDAPIMAAAQKAGVDFLISLDKKHFLSPKVKEHVLIKIVTPIEFIRAFERICLETEEGIH